MTVHRMLEVPAGVFTADADWANLNVSPEAAGGTVIRGLVAPIYIPRAGVELLWSATFYTGNASNSVAVATTVETISGEIVYESGDSLLNYKALAPVTTVLVKRANLEANLPVCRKAYIRLSAVSAVPATALYIWLTYEFVERRGT